MVKGDGNHLGTAERVVKQAANPLKEARKRNPADIIPGSGD